MALNADEPMTQSLRENRAAIFIAAIALIVTCGGMLVGATLWIDAAIRTSNDQALTAIHAQADIFTAAESKNDHRITVLEGQTSELSRATDHLSDKVDKLGAAESSLSTSVQILSDKLPDMRHR